MTPRPDFVINRAHRGMRRETVALLSLAAVVVASFVGGFLVGLGW
jgi:hypothetical protein